MNSLKPTATFTVIVALLVGSSVFAADRTFRQQTADGNGDYLFSQVNNWVEGSVPVAGDKAIIGNGLTATVSGNSTCGYFDISGVLQIKGSSKLTLDLNGVTANSSISGEMRLTASGAELAIANYDHTITGAGFIVGQHDSALLTVPSSRLLTSQVLIKGQMQIQGAGSFTNSGQVLANVSNGTLEVKCTGSIDDSPVASGNVSSTNYRWAVTSFSDAQLVFGASPASMEGHVYMSNGTLQVGKDPFGGDTIALSTTGQVKMDGGFIKCGVGDSFTRTD